METTDSRTSTRLSLLERPRPPSLPSSVSSASLVQCRSLPLAANEHRAGPPSASAPRTRALTASTATLSRRTTRSTSRSSSVSTPRPSSPSPTRPRRSTPLSARAELPPRPSGRPTLSSTARSTPPRRPTSSVALAESFPRDGRRPSLRSRLPTRPSPRASSPRASSPRSARSFLSSSLDPPISPLRAFLLLHSNGWGLMSGAAT